MAGCWRFGPRSPDSNSEGNEVGDEFSSVTSIRDQQLCLFIRSAIRHGIYFSRENFVQRGMIDHRHGGRGFREVLTLAREIDSELQAVVQVFKRSRVEPERFVEGSAFKNFSWVFSLSSG